MKASKLKKWLCGTAMMFALVSITSQACFAVSENVAEKNGDPSLNLGEVGIVRYKIPGKVLSKGLRGLDKTANYVVPSGSVQLFAAFPSDKVADPSDVSDPVTVVPVLDDAGAYLYTAFRVTASMKVDIKWYLDGVDVHTESNFEDPVDTGNLSPNYWYFAWFKPSSITPNGIHTLEVFVKKPGQAWSDSKKDSCTFLVLAYLVP